MSDVRALLYRPPAVSRDSSKAGEWTLVAEAQEKWDLCRQASWPER